MDWRETCVSPPVMDATLVKQCRGKHHPTIALKRVVSSASARMLSSLVMETFANIASWWFEMDDVSKMACQEKGNKGGMISSTMTAKANSCCSRRQ